MTKTAIAEPVPLAGEPGWSPTKPTKPAHVIANDAEAIAIAERLKPVFAAGARERDRERRLPFDEVDVFSQSGLWGITIPKAHGGAGVSQVTLAKVFATLAAGDPSLTQIAQNSFEIIDVIRLTGSEAQKRDLFGKFSRVIGSATPSRNSKARMSRASRHGSSRTGNITSSAGRSFTRPERFLPISCRLWRSMKQGMWWSLSPIAMRLG